MQTLDAYDVPKETAEKVLKSIMEILKPKKDAGDAEATTIYDRLGVLGMALAHQYANEEQFQTTITTVSRENVRLTDTIMVLSEQLAAANKMIEELVTQAAKEHELLKMHPLNSVI